MPSFNKDPAEFFRDMIQQMSTGASGELKTLIRLSNGGVRADSSSESSEEQNMNMKHFVVFRQEHHQPSLNGRLHEVVDGVRREWTDLVHRQPNAPIWLLLVLLLSLSALLWCKFSSICSGENVSVFFAHLDMIVSLCSHAPTHHNLSIHADEIQKLHPVEHYIDTVPIKVKINNV